MTLHETADAAEPVAAQEPAGPSDGAPTGVESVGLAEQSQPAPEALVPSRAPQELATSRRPRRVLRIVAWALALAMIAGLACALVITTMALGDQERLARTNGQRADHNRTVADAAAEESRQNAERAEQWQQRADDTRARLVEIQSRLDAAQQRVVSVQERLAGQQRAVRTLERRQRQLANEKAQVEDQRLFLERRSAELEAQTLRLESQASALIDVANGFITCKGGLSQLVDAALYEDYDWMLVNGPSIYGSCNSAEETLAGYQTTYG